MKLFKILFAYLGCYLLAASHLPVSLYADRSVSVMYYRAPKEAPKSAFIYQQNEKPLEIELNRWEFIEPFDLGLGATRLYFLPERLEDLSEMPKEAPSVLIPEGWEKVLILVFLDETNAVMPIKLQAIDAGDSVFGPGELLFINYTDTAIFGLVGEQKLMLKPKTSATIADPLSRDAAGDYPVKLDSAKGTIESRRFFIRQTWRHNPKMRRLVFITPKQRGRGITYYTAPIRIF